MPDWPTLQRCGFPSGMAIAYGSKCPVMSSGFTRESLAGGVILTGNCLRGRTLDYAVKAIYM